MRSHAMPKSQHQFVPSGAYEPNQTKPDVLGISTGKEITTVRRLLFLGLLVALLDLASCHKAAAPSTAITCSTTTGSSGSSSSSTCTDPVTNITLTISPATASVNVETPAQFAFSISGGTNNVVTWQVNKITGGNPMVGLIDSNGKYIAPAQVPSPATVTVGAVSFEDPNLSATSAVTIVPPPVVKITSPTLPVTVTSGVANKVNFQATVTGGTLNTVFWEVGTVMGAGGPGDATIGTIDANGVYSAPATPPIGSTVFVTAVSQDSATSFASVPVTISAYSTSSLQGHFAFSMSGKNASGTFVRAGSFFADGAGTLHSGVEDVNDASGVTATPISFAGTYTVTADGRGTLQFNDGLTPASFNFVLVNGADLQIIGFDSTGTATGQANAQFPSKFNALALNGSYVFDFTGVHGSNAISEIGEFKADGAGHITGGSIDVNDNGTPSQLQITGNTALPGQPPSYPSTYSAIDSGSGRGTLTLATSGATLHFAIYISTAGSARFVGTDSLSATGAVAGYSTQQDPNATFSLATLSGSYAFLLIGSGAGGAYASAGSFAADGHGNITSGVLDENFISSGNDTVNANVVLSGTSYTLASNGRGTIQLTGARAYVFYLASVNTAVFQEADANNPTIVRDGTFAHQQNASFALSQITGNYAIETADLSTTAGEGVTGQIATDGAGHISSGIVDINTAGTTHSGVAIGSTSSYSTSSSAGRGVMALGLATSPAQTRNFAVYVVDSTQAFVVQTDSGQPSAGTLQRQF
jgi:hypothetical protein